MCRSVFSSCGPNFLVLVNIYFAPFFSIFFSSVYVVGLVVRFCVSFAERTSLSLLLQTRKPPLNVLVMSINEDISVSTVNVIGRRLVIMELYQEAYMRINTITDGENNLPFLSELLWACECEYVRVGPSVRVCKFINEKLLFCQA